MGLLLLTSLSLWRYGGLDTGQRWGLRGAVILPALTYTTVGALILARHTRHRVGLLLLWVGVGSTLQVSLEEYAVYGLLVEPGRLPGALFAAWVCNWIWVPVAGAAASLLPLYFPNGHLASPRWRGVVVLTLLSLVTMMVGFGGRPGSFGSVLGSFDNPYGLIQWAELMNWVTAIGALAVFSAIGLSVLSLIRRLRRAQGVERQQLKWFVYAASLSVLLAPATRTNLIALQFLYLLCSTALPVAIGLAVLRYRLYDIDLIVNRALVYGALTTILAGVYFGSVVLLQSLLATLTGESRSALVTVLSTLAIAALFTPVRARVQVFIDRRFYRRKYDAARTLAAFGQAARTVVDLHPLTDQLLGVIQETMEPAHVSLAWVRQPGTPHPPPTS